MIKNTKDVPILVKIQRLDCRRRLLYEFNLEIAHVTALTRKHRHNWAHVHMSDNGGRGGAHVHTSDNGGRGGDLKEPQVPGYKATPSCQQSIQAATFILSKKVA